MNKLLFLSILVSALVAISASAAKGSCDNATQNCAELPECTAGFESGFTAAARYGDNLTEAGLWELAISASDGDNQTFITQSGYAWPPAAEVDFSLSYDPDEFMVTFQVDNETLAWNNLTAWLTENFEYPVFIGDYRNKNNIVFSWGAQTGNPAEIPTNDSIIDNVEIHDCSVYLEGNVSPGSAIDPPLPEFCLAPPRFKTPLPIVDMQYQLKNHTHYVDENAAQNPDFDNLITVNPFFGGPGDDWRYFLRMTVGPDANYVHAFFGTVPNQHLPLESKIIDLGMDRVYYVDGHVWFLDPYIENFIIQGRATIIAKGNIFIFNDLIYNDPEQDMLVLIALGEGYPPRNPIFPSRFGNIFISDVTLDSHYGEGVAKGRVNEVDAFLIAARDFYYNLDWWTFFVFPLHTRYNIDPRLGPFPTEGLKIFGGLTIQSLGSGYTDTDYGIRKVVRPYIRRDSYAWKNPDNGTIHYADAFFDNATSPGNPMWYGKADTGELFNNNRHDLEWNSNDGSNSNQWHPLDVNLIRDDPCNGSDCPGSEWWAYDDNSTGSIPDDPDPYQVERMRFKRYNSATNEWQDFAGNTAVASPVTHIPLIIEYDERISGPGQPPGLPEDDNADREIPNKNPPAKNITVLVKGDNSTAATELTELTLNGETVCDVRSGTEIKGLRIPLSSQAQSGGFLLAGKAKLTRDGTGSEEVPGFDILVMHSVCGDGSREFPEACDDGNNIDCDGCSSGCADETPNASGGYCDRDDDGIGDDMDNCPDDANLDQADTDGDGIGDVCDCFPSEISPEGSCTQTWDPNDCCSNICGRYSQNWWDIYCIDDASDLGPGTCDAGGGLFVKNNIIYEGSICCDGTLLAGDNCDIDDDGFNNDVDNCPNTCNSEQLDADGDDIGDVCDSDPGCGGCGQDPCEQPC